LRPRTTPFTYTTLFRSNNAGSTFVANDTTDFILGTQACKITTGGTGAAANVSKTAGSAFDTTGKVIRLRLKVDDITHMVGLNLLDRKSTRLNSSHGSIS